MGDLVELRAADDHGFDAYRAQAAGTRRGGLIVVQEIFGVNQHVREVCDGYAAAGYEVYAPALFDRVERGVELGYTEDDIAAGMALRGKLDWTPVLLDIQAALGAMRGYGEVGIVGYCFGGACVWMAAARVIGLSAAVGYYGGGIAGLLDNKPQCPTMLHFGEQDAMIPMTDVDKVRAAFPDLPVHTYDADHGFNCDHRGSYDETAAKLARERTLAFFAEHVG